MIKHIAAVLVITLALGSLTSAREFTVPVEKAYLTPGITEITVKGGTVTGLPPGREPDTFTIKVTLPDGVCETRLHVRLGMSGENTVDWNFCTAGTLRIGDFRRRRPQPPLLSCRVNFPEWRAILETNKPRSEVATKVCVKINTQLGKKGDPACICN